VEALPVRVSRRAVAAGIALLMALGAAAFLSPVLGTKLEAAFSGLPEAHPLVLTGGCALFVVSLLCSAGAWRATIRVCSGEIGRGRAAACYGAGSLVNSLLPARIGDGVRVALFSRALPGEGGVWTAGGIFAAIGVARTFVLFGLVVVAAAAGAFPVLPLAALGGLLATGIAVVVLARRTQARSRASHVLDAFRALGCSPRTCVALACWVVGSLATRVAAVAVTANALNVRSPLLAGLVIVPALELASLLPLTPGNLGITSGAVAVALNATGTDLTHALSVGIGLHAVEMAAGLSFGVTSVVVLGATRSARARRIGLAALAAASVGVGAVVAGILVL
jgi:uncharacterized membrane protein YbhN (UPF0104 family)